MSGSKFRAAAVAQRVCAVTGEAGPHHAHHAVTSQVVRREGGNPDDPRNALRVKWKVHLAHHAAEKRIPLTALTDENIEYAFELLGPAAADYLRRVYEGEDPRVTDRLLERQ